MPHLGADAVAEAGRVAVVPGHLILGTAHGAAADRMDPAHQEGIRAHSKGAAGDGQGARGWQQLGLAVPVLPVISASAGHCCVQPEAFALPQFSSHALLPGLQSSAAPNPFVCSAKNLFIHRQTVFDKLISLHTEWLKSATLA